LQVRFLPSPPFLKKERNKKMSDLSSTFCAVPKELVRDVCKKSLLEIKGHREAEKERLINELMIPYEADIFFQKKFPWVKIISKQLSREEAEKRFNDLAHDNELWNNQYRASLYCKDWAENRFNELLKMCDLSDEHVTNYHDIYLSLEDAVLIKNWKD
jgi:hypothetical protein